MEEKEAESGVSTSASGPAGPHFEAQVSAFYFLSMLAGAPPRGLPGTRISKVLLQQANAKRPLDDITVYATDSDGNPAVLEIQVKRSITFSPSDQTFKKVVGQIAEVMERTDFWTTQYNLAVATSKRSWKIDGAYQDVLAMARQMGDAKTFTSQLKLPGVANDDMRTFVKTLQTHLEDLKAPSDDETTWKLLCRLQILTFDFTATGSVSEDLCRERCLRLLHSADTLKVDAFWGNLIEYSISIAKNGGNKDRESLINHFRNIGYKFADDRRHFNTISTIAESSSQALADIDNQVANVVLIRNEHIMSVHTAFDTGRYVEIRGDAGVGKSGILRQIAESHQAQGNVLVFSPRRCVPGGWSALKAQLDFDGTKAKELLIELAIGGGVIIFVDNLDMFTEEERLTVNDMLRAAAEVESVSVLATARTDFGVDDPSWLPKEALDKLRCAEPITIDQLSNTEIDQLKSNAPRLSHLLSDSHPARKVTRNLFRLSRIANKSASDPIPHTEAEMAYDWWKSGDGKPDANRRDRIRLLEQLATEALSGPVGLDVSKTPSSAIDALVKSGTLTSLGANRVSFRHDVLLEWSIGCLLFEQPNLIINLNLKKFPSPIYLRGIELTARLLLENKLDGSEWSSLLETVSSNDNHKAWRRAAILAVARCEAISAIFPKIQSTLVANNAAVLRELLRTVSAVEVIPAHKAFAALEIDIPSGFSIPNAPLWTPIILWLLKMDGGIPKIAVPEVTDFFVDFSMGTFGYTGYTEITTHQLYYWLKQIRALKNKNVFDEEPSEWDVLDRNQIESLFAHLNFGFISFAKTTPALAKEYLTELTKLRSDDSLITDILKNRGTLAQAAPEELAKLTEHALIEKPDPVDRIGNRERDEAFTYVDHEFIPHSPAQGPFYELLQHAPEVGLQLIHNLVGHAISHFTKNREVGNNKITLVYESGLRDFPWPRSYYWSRSCDVYTITSALMALEAWAHKRIEADEPFNQVLEDVLGPSGSCAAYLLVAVDLIISHWPKSVGSAVEFLGCPELLCIEQSRLDRDRLGEPDLFGIKKSSPEPKGLVSIEYLNKRLSRKRSIDWLIGNITARNKLEEITKLKGLLEAAAKRIGPINDESTHDTPEFMVVHALNLLNPLNWIDTTVDSNDGRVIPIKQYVYTEDEKRLIHKTSTASASRKIDYEMQFLISDAIDGSKTLTNEQLEAAAKWAAESVLDDNEDASEDRMQVEALLATAMMIYRDGNEALKSTYGDWASNHLSSTLASNKERSYSPNNDSLKYNFLALAYAGKLYQLSPTLEHQEVNEILQITVQKFLDIAAGFGKSINSKSDFDDRLQKSILRCALQSCIVPRRQWNGYDDEGDQESIREKSIFEKSEQAVNLELKWLFKSGTEPAWPTFPTKSPRKKKPIRIPGANSIMDDPTQLDPTPEDYFVYHQTAASWLRQLSYRRGNIPFEWLNEIVQAYLSWTITLNGANLQAHEEVDDAPLEWNNEFFRLAARNIAFLKSEEVVEDTLTLILSLPDRHFFDVGTVFLRSLDEVYFDGDRFSTELAVAIRERFALRLMAAYGWKRLFGTRENTIERHIGPFISVLFFNDYNFISKTNCYLYEKGIARISPFLPVLLSLIKSGPSPFSAIVSMNLMEVSPKFEHLDFLTQVARAWLNTYPDFRSFWIDQGFGQRWCQIIKTIHLQNTGGSSISTEAYEDVLGIVSELISLGIPEATQLEEQINGR